MKNVTRLIASATMLVAATLAASAASAQSFSPAGQGFTISSGAMTLHQTVGPINCTLSGSGSVAASGGNANITSANFGGINPLCLVLVENTPWNIVPLSTTTVRAYVDLKAVNSTCKGYIDGTFSSGPGANQSTLSFPYQIVVGTNSPDCYAGGNIVVTSTSSSPVVIVP